MSRTLCFFTFLSLSLIGCTGLKTNPDLTKAQSLNEAIEGVPYALPMVQYDLGFEYTLASCEPAEKTFAISIKPTVKTNYVTGERYVIDYEALSSLWKTTNFSIEVHKDSGTLKTINVSAEDKTSDVLKSLAKTTLTTLGISVPAPGIQTLLSTNGQKVTYAVVNCTQTAKDLLEKLKLETDALKLNTAELAAIEKEIDILKHVARFEDASTTAAVIRRIIQEKSNVERGIESRNEEIKTIRKSLTFSVERKWPNHFDITQGQFDDTRQAVSHWTKNPTLLRVERVDGAIGDEGSCKYTDDAIADREHIERCISDKMKMTVVLVDTSTILPQCISGGPLECIRSPTNEEVTQARDNDPKKAGDEGVFVRPPVRGELRICKGTNACPPGKKENLVIDASEVIPQLGQLRFLPFRNGLFENNQLVVSLQENGTLEKVQYKETGASAAVFAETASNIAGQVDSFLDKREEERKKAFELEKAEGSSARAEELALLNFEIEKLKKQAELQKLNTPDPPEKELIELMQSETSQLEAQIALLNARKTLLELEQQINN